MRFSVTAGALGGEKCAERGILDPLEACDDERGVEVRTGGIGVRVVLWEKGVHLVLAERLVFVGDEAREVDIGDAGGLGDLLGELAPRAVAALNLAILPFVADGERKDDGRRALGPHVCDHLSHIPAVGVDDLVLFGDGVVDLLRLLAKCRDRAAGAEWAGGARGLRHQALQRAVLVLRLLQTSQLADA